ncbi:MAG: hypothetical protein A2V70_13130 [Planctomycetes bacterium RBG_13_63_9]|nr:MAG: hypothetical protein A2V70_13130 [Planctomycetes bacterium RBG_13_63_9]
MKLPRFLPIQDVAQVARGLLMGGADIIPGVSGGTVALILGIYERLVAAISHFDLALIAQLRRRNWTQAAAHCDLRFLVTLVLGILVGIGVLGYVLKYLLEQQLELTLSAFFGLILASSIVVAQSIQSWDLKKTALMLAGALLAYWLVAQPFMTGYDDYGYLFLCGVVAICAMILPGISGAFILLIMGKYKDVLDVIHKLERGVVTLDGVLTLVVFACGCAVGLLTFSKFLRWLLARYHGETLAVLCGFMIGSLRRIWPYKAIPLSGEKIDITTSQLDNVLPQTVDGRVLASVALAVAAVVLVLALDRMARRAHKD